MTDDLGKLAQFRVGVRASAETNDHEVCLYADDQNLVDRFGDKSIGLDPSDILISPCPLSASEIEHECLIGRCNCGVLGCGDVWVRIRRENDVVLWSAPQRRPEPICFSALQYRAEIDRVLTDHSWETPERTAARLIFEQVDRQRLAGHGLEFTWASGRSAPGQMTVALLLEPGPYQVLVRLPWPASVDPAALAKSVVAVLARPPSSWPDVEWLPQVKGLGSPSLAGPRWQRWRR